MHTQRNFWSLILIVSFTLISTGGISAQSSVFEPITASTIVSIELLHTLPQGEVIRLFPDEGQVILRNEDNYTLYSLATGDIVQSFILEDADVVRHARFRAVLPDELTPDVDLFADAMSRLIRVEYQSLYPEYPHVMGTRYDFDRAGFYFVEWNVTPYEEDPDDRGTMIQVGIPGDVLVRRELSTMIEHILWSPDESKFVGYAGAFLPGQMPVVFTAEGERLHTLRHDFPREEDVLGIELIVWLDNDHLLTGSGDRDAFAEAYIWDVNTGERSAVILPFSEVLWHIDASADYGEFLLWHGDTVRVVDQAGNILNTFPNRSHDDLHFVNDNTALLAWDSDGRPLQLLGLDGTLLSESVLTTIPFSDDIYPQFMRDFTIHDTVMAASLGDDCTQTESAITVWDMTDISQPIATLPYSGYLDGINFGGDDTLIYANLYATDTTLRPCDLYSGVKDTRVFWNLQGERVFEVAGKSTAHFMLNNTLLLLEFGDRIEVWGIPSG